MGARTGIEFCTRTSNIVVGCEPVSPGCDGCWAILSAARQDHLPGRGGLTVRDPRGRRVWSGNVALFPDLLRQPQSWTKAELTFVPSMGDLFHDDVPDEFIAAHWVVMYSTSQEVRGLPGGSRKPVQTYQVLTKRPARMRAWVRRWANSEQRVAMVTAARDRGWCTDTDVWKAPFMPAVMPNAWLGVSVENQHWADIRIPKLLETPAAVRWLSCEPLIGPVDLRSIPYRGDTDYLLDVLHKRYRGPGQPPSDGWGTTPFGSGMSGLGGIHWVVVGGESGPNRRLDDGTTLPRPMQLEWARSLRDQCVGADVPFFFKQWGESVPISQMPEDTFMSWDIVHGTGAWGRDQPWHVGKKRAGRLLDEREWLQFPAGTRWRA